MTTQPLLSIGLPVYNGERFLRSTLEALLAQTFDDFELLISDNASDDGTEEICREFAAKDRRVKYLRQPENLGASWNYNHVFHISNGKYFKWSACDDICEPQFVEKSVGVLEQRPNFVLAYSRSQIIDINDKPIEIEEDELYLDSNDVRTRFIHTLSAMRVCHNLFFGVIRREVLAKTRLKGAFLAADRCLLAELSLYGAFYQIQERLFKRRIHPQSISASRECQSFFDPRLKSKIVMPEWRVAKEHLLSAKLAPLPASLKLTLSYEVLKWMVAKRGVLLAQLAVAGELWLQKLLPAELSTKQQFMTKINR